MSVTKVESGWYLSQKSTSYYRDAASEKQTKIYIIFTRIYVVCLIRLKVLNKLQQSSKKTLNLIPKEKRERGFNGEVIKWVESQKNVVNFCF